MSKRNINITLKQLVEWGSVDPGLKQGKRSAEDYISLMEQYTPSKVFELAKNTILQENTSVNDVSFTITDQHTGKKFPFAPPTDVVLG